MSRRSRASVPTVLAIIPLMALSMLLTASPTMAAPLTPGTAESADTVTLSLSNGATFSYASSTTPQFAATVVLAAKPKASYPMFLVVQLDGTGAKFGNIPFKQSSDQLTYYYQIDTAWSSITLGSHTAVATFTNPSTGITTQSNSVGFTVAKGGVSMQCFINNFNSPITPGYTLNIQMTPESGDPSAPVDWQNATYTVSFVGATTVARSNLTPDSNDIVAAQAPTQVGRYTEVDCTFNGTNLFSSATTNAVGQPVLVSDEHALGGVQLFTNPTTLVANQSAALYVVLHMASGGPTPSGGIGFRIGNNYTAVQTIGPDGTLVVNTTMPSNLAAFNQIQISYTGDAYYNSAVFNFPLTNPPIPGNGGGGGGGGGGSGAKPTATPSASATATPSQGETAAGGSAPTPTTSTPARPLLASTRVSPVNGMLWWIALAVLLVLGGGLVGTLLVMRRTKASAQMASAAADAVAATSTSPTDVANRAEHDSEPN